MEMVKKFLKEEDGMGVVEVVLIIIVLITLVLLFKDRITQVVSSLLDRINNDATSV